jgi:hypothetical protein
MVLTVEPGIYIAADDERRLRRCAASGSASRTTCSAPGGHEVLTAAIPKQVAEPERCRARDPRRRLAPATGSSGDWSALLAALSSIP